MPFEWLNTFHQKMEKYPDYAKKKLAAYRLGMKAKGSIVGVAIQPGPDCCQVAQELPVGKIYHPDEAPTLPLPGCPQAQHCGCIYQPVMNYQESAK